MLRPLLEVAQSTEFRRSQWVRKDPEDASGSPGVEGRPRREIHPHASDSRSITRVRAACPVDRLAAGERRTPARWLGATCRVRGSGQAFKDGYVSCAAGTRPCKLLPSACSLRHGPRSAALMLQTCLLPDRDEPYNLSDGACPASDQAVHREERGMADVRSVSPAHPAMRHWEACPRRCLTDAHEHRERSARRPPRGQRVARARRVEASPSGWRWPMRRSSSTAASRHRAASSDDAGRSRLARTRWQASPRPPRGEL